MHLNPRTRKSLRKKIEGHTTIRDSLVFSHRLYSNMTGFLHYLPFFFILGVEKGGTTSLYSYLTKHPDMKPAVTKEPNYFSKYYSRGTNWYKACFPFRGKTCDATPRYFDYPYAPQRIKSIIPESKFILLLRNPIDRAWSQHSMVVRGGHEIWDFDNAIRYEKGRTESEWKKMLNDPTYYSDDYFRHAYLSRGIYVNSLKRWFEHFDRKQFFIIDSQEFFENPSNVFENVLKFLELSKFHLEEFRIKGKANKIKMSSEHRKQLNEFFKPHNEDLFKLIGRKFDW